MLAVGNQKSTGTAINIYTSTSNYISLIKSKMYNTFKKCAQHAHKAKYAFKHADKKQTRW